MIKKIIVIAGCSVGFCLSGCYQAHSDDDLREVPVTNNPNIVPGASNSKFTSFGY